MSTSPEMSGKSDSLPFDPIAVLLGIRQKKKWIILTVVVAIAGGVTAGSMLGKRSWDSYCVLLYQPPSVELSGRVYQAPAVQTQLNLVKLRSNLQSTRERLQIPASLESLASACDITNPRDTQLLIVKGTADAGMLSASIANTLAEVFTENQRKVRNGELGDALSYLEKRKGDLAEKLRRVQDQSNGVAVKEPEDLVREIRSSQTKLDALDVIYEKALSERKSLQIQGERVSGIMEEVKQDIADEKEESASVQGLSNLNIRVERIREAIMDARAEQTNDITLSQWKNRLEYDKTLLDQGYLSSAVYDHEMAQFEKLKAQALDSEQIQEWKTELEGLYAKIRPSDEKESASAPILRDLLLRSFNLELALKGVEEHITKTKESRDSIADELQEMLASRNVSGSEQWQVQSWRDELTDVEQSIAMVQSLRDSNTADFQIVSPAIASPQPSSSNRRLLAIGASGMLGMLGLAMVVATELVQTQVRTRGEVALLLQEPVLASISYRPSDSPLHSDVKNHEEIRSVTNAVMRNAKGKRILVMGCRRGDGCTTLTQQVAACIARQEKRVTILDCDLRAPDQSIDTTASSDPGRTGLSELIQNVDSSINEGVHATPTSNLSLVTRGHLPIDPDLLGSNRMHEVVDGLAAGCDYLFIDGPPVSESTDAEFLTEYADAILLVVRSKQCSRTELRNLAKRVRDSRKQFLGVLLNQMDPIYIR